MPPAKDTDAQMLLVNSLVSLTALSKLFSFFRANPTLARIILLINEVVKDMFPFIYIYYLLLLQQVVSYILAGAHLYK